jgi:hypothetical protein
MGFTKEQEETLERIATKSFSDLLPCPKCKSKVIICGSECYPESGMGIECNNFDCDFELELKVDIRTNKVRKALAAAYNILAKE